MAELVIVADDLSGAAESAAAALLRTTRMQVLLSAAQATEAAGTARVVAVDLDTRRATDAEVLSAAADTAPLAVGAGLVLVKVDSLLRGRPDRLVAALATGATEDAAATLVVACPATPALGRTVVDGIVHVDGTPLPRTDLWRVEAQAAPSSVAQALGAPEARLVPLETVRGPRESLTAALGRASGTVVVDAELDTDLDAVVAALADLTDARPLLVGAGGLASATARSLAADESAPGGTRAEIPSATSVLVVIGSAAPSVAAEVEELRAHGADVIDLPVDDLLAGTASVPRGTGAAVTVVRPAAADLDPAVSVRLVAALADAAASASGADALVLTGGETARAVLTRLGVRSMTPVAAVGGAVTARTDDGRVVVTRPGSFGGARSLADIVSSLSPSTTKEPS